MSEPQDLLPFPDEYDDFGSFSGNPVLDDAKDCFDAFTAFSVSFLAEVLLVGVLFWKLLKAFRQQKALFDAELQHLRNEMQENEDCTTDHNLLQEEVSNLRLQLSSSTQNTAGIDLQDVESTICESTFNSPEMDSNEDTVTAPQGVESTVCESTFNSPEMDSNEDVVTAPQGVESTICESTFNSPEMNSNEDAVTAPQGVESTVCESTFNSPEMDSNEDAVTALQDAESTVCESTFNSPEMDYNEDAVTGPQDVASTVCESTFNSPEMERTEEITEDEKSYIHFMGLQIPVKVHPEEGTQVTLDVPRERHPVIASRNERTKKEIHWKAKVDITMPCNEEPTSSAIIIKGELQNLQKAAKLIEKILKKLQR